MLFLSGLFLCTEFYNVQGITSAGFVASYGEYNEKVKAKETALALGAKMVKMAKVLKTSELGIFDAHSHFAYGTHTH